MNQGLAEAFEGQGLAEAFSEPLPGIEDFQPESVSIEPPQKEEKEITLSDIATLRSMNDEGRQIKPLDEGNQLDQLRQAKQDQAVRNAEDFGSSLAGGFMAGAATPGPPMVKAGAGILGAIAGPEAFQGFKENGIKGAAAGIGKTYGVNEEDNIQKNLEAFRSAPGKAEAIKPMKPRTMGVETKDLLQSGIY
jgi:hypothetical protein